MAGSRLVRRVLVVTAALLLLLLAVLLLRGGRVDIHIADRLMVGRAPPEQLLESTPMMSAEGLHPADSNNNGDVELVKALPRVPVDFWLKSRDLPMFYKNESCARMPSILELEFNNLHWQTMQTSNGTFQLYSAYYDVRPLSVSEVGPAVRILGMVNHRAPAVSTHCQLWFEEQHEPVLQQTLEYRLIWNEEWGAFEQGVYQPYLITCPVPEPHRGKVPVSVSLVEQPCDTATNHLKVLYEKPALKKGFAVCVKGLDFPQEDLSARLAEWMELLALLGADKVFLYELQVHPNMRRVLRHYERQGRAEVTSLSLPGGQPNAQALQHLYLLERLDRKRQNEVIPYNDCLYRNLYSYRYVALLDIDEVIMPLRAGGWRELMDRVEREALADNNETRASYNVRNVYFFDDLIDKHGWSEDVPRYMHMLQHVYRSKKFTEPYDYVKCFHDPERVLTLHNHFPLACLGSDCDTYSIDTEDAQLRHYRADCTLDLQETCHEYRQQSVRDTAIWRYREQLIARTADTLTRVGLLGPPAQRDGQRHLKVQGAAHRTHRGHAHQARPPRAS